MGYILSSPWRLHWLLLGGGQRTNSCLLPVRQYGALPKLQSWPRAKCDLVASLRCSSEPPGQTVKGGATEERFPASQCPGCHAASLFCTSLYVICRAVVRSDDLRAQVDCLLAYAVLESLPRAGHWAGFQQLMYPPFAVSSPAPLHCSLGLVWL